MQNSLKGVLESIEKELGKELYLTSGARCSEYNEKIGGSKNSAHIYGLAADILIENSMARYKLIKILLNKNIKRLGIAKSFIHIDIGVGEYAQEVIWLY